MLEELRAHHDPLYGSRSRSSRAEVRRGGCAFADGSVDLLHLDGCHHYEAVAHDLETWLPKLSDRGVVLLHDTHVREPGFGVWRLWEELSPLYPSFAFAHGHGLGVLAVGGSVEAEFVAFLETACRDPATASFFAALGSRVAEPARQRRLLAAVGERLTIRESELATVAGERERAEAARERAEAASERLRLERDGARPRPRSCGSSASGRRRSFAPASTTSQTSFAHPRGG